MHWNIGLSKVKSYLKSENFTEAETELRKILQFRKDTDQEPRVLLECERLVREYYKKCKPDDAMAIWRAIQATHPDIISHDDWLEHLPNEVYEKAAKKLSQKGNVDRSLQYWGKNIEVHCKEVRDITKQANRASFESSWLTRWLIREEMHHISKICYTVGKLYVHKNLPEKALPFLEKALDIPKAEKTIDRRLRRPFTPWYRYWKSELAKMHRECKKARQILGSQPTHKAPILDLIPTLEELRKLESGRAKSPQVRKHIRKRKPAKTEYQRKLDAEVENTKNYSKEERASEDKLNEQASKANQMFNQEKDGMVALSEDGYYEAGKHNYDEGRLNRALAWFKLSIEAGSRELDPGCIWRACEYIGRIYLQKKLPEKAVPFLQKTLELVPIDRNWAYGWGRGTKERIQRKLKLASRLAKTMPIEREPVLDFIPCIEEFEKQKLKREEEEKEREQKVRKEEERIKQFRQSEKKAKEAKAKKIEKYWTPQCTEKVIEIAKKYGSRAIEWREIDIMETVKGVLPKNKREEVEFIVSKGLGLGLGFDREDLQDYASDIVESYTKFHPAGEIDVKDYLRPYYKTEKNLVKKFWNPLWKDALERVVKKYNWLFPWFVAEEIIKVTPKKMFSEFRRACASRGITYYNALMRYAELMRWRLGIKMKTPQWRKCKYCGKQFFQGDLKLFLLKKPGIKVVDYCNDCLAAAFGFEGGKEKAKKPESLKQYLLNLINVVGFIPSATSLKDPREIVANLSEERTDKVVPALIELPLIKEYEKRFGSWLNALVSCGVLATPARRATFGTECIAEDGHKCRSFAEKTIDDWLFKNGISHECEPFYPDDEILNPSGSFRADWLVGDTFIEYVSGLSNEYNRKMEKKRELSRRYSIQLIEINAEDLFNLDEKLHSLRRNKEKDS